jgi:hypothetical protein
MIINSKSLMTIISGTSSRSRHISLTTNNTKDDDKQSIPSGKKN